MGDGQGEPGQRAVGALLAAPYDVVAKHACRLPRPGGGGTLADGEGGGGDEGVIMAMWSEEHCRYEIGRPLLPAPGWLRKVTSIGHGLLRGAEWGGENLGPIVFVLTLLYGIGIMIWQWLEADFFTGLLVGAILAPILGFLTAVLALPLLWAALIGATMLRLCCEFLASLGDWKLPAYRPAISVPTELACEVLPTKGRAGRDRKTDFLTGLVLGMVLGLWLDD